MDEDESIRGQRWMKEKPKYTMQIILKNPWHYLVHLKNINGDHLFELGAAWKKEMFGDIFSKNCNPATPNTI